MEKKTRKFLRIYIRSSAFVIILLVLLAVSPLAYAFNKTFGLIMIIVPIFVIIFSFYYVSNYLKSGFYKLEDKLYIRKDIFYKKFSPIPYDEISEININQGDIDKFLNLYKIDIVTTRISSFKAFLKKINERYGDNEKHAEYKYGDLIFYTIYGLSEREVKTFKNTMESKTDLDVNKSKTQHIIEKKIEHISPIIKFIPIVIILIFIIVYIIKFGFDSFIEMISNMFSE